MIRFNNVVITCVDNIATRKKVNSIFREVNENYTGDRKPYYWMDFGNENNIGQVVMGGNNYKKEMIFLKRRNGGDTAGYPKENLIPTVSELFPDYLKQKDKKDIPSCSVAESIAKQDLFTNSILAQLGCNILWKLFRQGYIEHHGAFMNLETLTVKPIKIS